MTALFVSPHLDDVAFSCGGTLALLAATGTETVLLTCFTKSVPDPRGFALECQLDKGLPADVDYMALRRAEDVEFARLAGVAEVVHLDHAEAPHRGYESARELFSGVRRDDEAWKPLAEDLRRAMDRVRPEKVYAPQGLGGHVDHEQTIRAYLAATEGGASLPETYWYRDAPYAIRNPGAGPSVSLPPDLRAVPGDIRDGLRTKLDAIPAYRTQLGFQFGGEEEMRKALSEFACAEARRYGMNGDSAPAEVFLKQSVPDASRRMPEKQ